MVIKRDIFCLLIIELLCGVLALLVPVENQLLFCVIGADAVILATIIVIFRNHFEAVSLFFFNITYFLFLLGGATVTMIENTSIASYIGASLSIKETSMVGFIVLFGIIIINSTYYLRFSSIKISFGNFKFNIKNFQTSKITRLQIYFVSFVFAIAAICKLFMALENLVYSQSFGYVALYTREVSNLPSVVRYIGALFYFSFLLFLSAKLDKKTTYLGITTTLFIESIILGSGDRGEAVCGILIIVIYVLNRCKKEPSFLKHKKTVLFVSLLFIPFALYILQVVKYLRVGNINTLEFWDTISEFFKSQGVSLGIVGHGITLRDDISNLAGHNFIIKQIQGYLQQNVLFRTVFGIPLIRGNTIEMAMSGLSYGSTMAYLRFPNTYLNGVGCGTCFLAELFQDGSWIGLILGCGFVGFLLRKLKSFETNNWIIMALYLNCMRVILLLPRGAYFKWITEIFSVPNIMLLILLILLTYKRNK